MNVGNAAVWDGLIHSQYYSGNNLGIVDRRSKTPEHSLESKIDLLFDGYFFG